MHVSQACVTTAPFARNGRCAQLSGLT